VWVCVWHLCGGCVMYMLFVWCICVCCVCLWCVWFVWYVYVVYMCVCGMWVVCVGYVGGCLWCVCVCVCVVCGWLCVCGTCVWYVCGLYSMCPAAAKSRQSCPTLCNPIDGSPPGSPVPGILQARTLERVAISFSNARK